MQQLFMSLACWRNSNRHCFLRMHFFAAAFLFFFLSNCAGVKPYEKEYLLDPLMDEGALQSLNSDFRGNWMGSFERLSSAGAGSGGSSSCPTCGG